MLVGAAGALARPDSMGVYLVMAFFFTVPGVLFVSAAIGTWRDTFLGWSLAALSGSLGVVTLIAMLRPSDPIEAGPWLPVVAITTVAVLTALVARVIIARQPN